MAEPARNICPKHNVTMDVESDCSTCHGDGMIEGDQDFGFPKYEKCWRCDGSGVSPWLDCEFCLEEDRDEFC